MTIGVALVNGAGKDGTTCPVPASSDYNIVKSSVSSEPMVADQPSQEEHLLTIPSVGSEPKAVEVSNGGATTKVEPHIETPLEASAEISNILVKEEESIEEAAPEEGKDDYLLACGEEMG